MLRFRLLVNTIIEMIDSMVFTLLRELNLQKKVI